MTARLRAMVALEWRVESRYAIPAVLLGLAVVWSLALVLVPAAAARAATPYVLFFETTAVAVTVVGALILRERATGATAALLATPIRRGEYVAARLATLGVLTAGGVALVLLAGRLGDRMATALPAAVLSGLILLGIGAGIAHRSGSFVAFLLAVPWPLLPLLGIPPAVAIGLLTGPVWYVVPTTGALALLRGEEPYPAGVLLGYLGLWVLAAVAYAVGSVRREAAAPRSRRTERTAPLPTRPRWLVFPRADLRNVHRETMLVALVLSPLLLGLALRFGLPPFESWLSAEHGLDLSAYRPVLALVAVLVHVPMSFGMTAALVVLDDLEDGVLGIVRTSPLGLRRYLAYRLATVTAAATAGLAVAAPLSGIVPATAWASAVLAVPVAPLFLLATLTLAGGRVQGVAATKALGFPTYIPIAAWWLTGPVGFLLAPLPTYWVVRAWDGPTPMTLAGGLVCTALWAIVLTRPVLPRLAAR